MTLLSRISDVSSAVRVVAALNRGSQYRPHLHGTLSAHQQEHSAMQQYAHAMRKLEAELERRDGVSAAKEPNGKNSRRITPISINAGKRHLSKDGDLGHKKASGAAAEDAIRAGIGQRAAATKKPAGDEPPTEGAPDRGGFRKR